MVYTLVILVLYNNFLKKTSNPVNNYFKNLVFIEIIKKIKYTRNIKKKYINYKILFLDINNYFYNYIKYNINILDIVLTIVIF